MIPSAFAGKDLEIKWFATAKDVRGRKEGEFSLPVGADPIPLLPLLDESTGEEE